jgi:hypothetical protein
MRVGAVCALLLAIACGAGPDDDPASPTTLEGGAGDAGAQGGGSPPAGGSADGGGGGTGGEGGGAGDGAPDRFASASLERLDASAECDGLVPAAAPVPFVARIAPPAGGRCLAGISDGTGAVALGAGGAGGPVRWQVLSSAGVRAGGFEAALPLVSQPAGWHGLVVRGPTAEPEVELRAFGADGATRRASRLSPPAGTALAPRWGLAEDPRGGSAVVFRAQEVATLGDRFVLHRFDAAGAPSAPAEVAFFMRGRVAEGMGLGVSATGDALVVMPAADAWRPTWTSAGGSFLADGTDPHDVVPLAPLALHPLLDGGLALRVDGRFARAYDHLARASGPAPAWLAERATWSFRATPGRRGYAVFPPAGEAAPACTQRFDLVAASGRLCGRITLREPGTGCTTGALDAGRDGTIVQQSGKDACTFRWWPGLLGP